MATFTLQTTSDEGAAVTWNTANGGGDDFANNGTYFILIKNDDGSPTTVTVVTGATVGTLAIADRAIVVSANSVFVAGPFTTGTYNNPSTGKVSLTYSSVTSLSIGLLKLGSSS